MPSYTANDTNGSSCLACNAQFVGVRSGQSWADFCESCQLFLEAYWNLLTAQPCAPVCYLPANVHVQRHQAQVDGARGQQAQQAHVRGKNQTITGSALHLDSLYQGGKHVGLMCLFLGLGHGVVCCSKKKIPLSSSVCELICLATSPSGETAACSLCMAC